MMNKEQRPVSIVAIGAGNRTNKYLEYVRRNPDKARLIGVVELNDLRRQKVADEFSLDASCCYTDYRDFFRSPLKADAVMICTPENMHFEPAMLAIEAGYHVLLEKPIAQTLEECLAIGEAARRKNVIVSVCHVLRYHPYFIKLKELACSGELGNIISINHCTSVGVDRATHSFVRGLWSREADTNPMLISKCCHDIDFLLWLTKTRCRKITSFGSLRWFRSKNAPEGSAERCIDCKVEAQCPFSAVDLYRVRRDWISNFDIPQGKTIDQVIEDELHLHVPIAGLAKDRKHRTSELLFGFPPLTIGIKQNTPLFHLLEQIQNEVHRFAITFHRDKRSKNQVASVLDEIPGIGEKRKNDLLKAFKSVTRIKHASLEEIAEVVGHSIAKNIKEKLQE